MISDEVLTGLASALGSPPAPNEGDATGLPEDVRRLLGVVGGVRSGSLRFFARSEVEAIREYHDTLAAQVEAGTAPRAAHALWAPGWYPIARNAADVFAYAPHACLRGPPRQVVCMDLTNGESWETYPSMAFWAAALTLGRAETNEQGLVTGARVWAAARDRLFRVELPTGAQRSAATRWFDPPRMNVSFGGAPRRDFTLWLLEAFSYARAPAEVLRELADALDAVTPQCHLRSLATVARDDAAALSRAWLVPLLARHAAKKDVTHLRFGVNTHGTAFRLWAVPGALGAEPNQGARIANGTTCFEALGALVNTPELGSSTDVWTFVTTSASLLIRELLEAAAPHLPWTGPVKVMLDSTLLGVCDTDGFVPTPLALARAEAASTRGAEAAFLKARNYPGVATQWLDHPTAQEEPLRRLEHPDGRAWEVRVSADSWQFTSIEPDGERDTFTRPLTTGWEAETFIAAQHRAGFTSRRSW